MSTPSREAIDQALAALRPFATCVYNDNGDVTLSGHLGLTASEFIRARRAYQVLERLRAHPSPGMPVYAPIKMSEIRLHVGEGSLPAWAVLEGVNIILRKRTDDARSAGNETPEALSPARSEEVPHNDLPLTSKTAQDLKSPLPAVEGGVDDPYQERAGQRPLAEWENPQVQQIYELICDVGTPPNSEEHWEGYLARVIVAALAGNAQGAEPVAPEAGWLQPTLDKAADRAAQMPSYLSGSPAPSTGPAPVAALAEFVSWALQEGAWQGGDLDGGGIQDKALSLGLIVTVPYDPEVHGECDFGTEPGEDWFVLAPAVQSLLPATQREGE